MGELSACVLMEPGSTAGASFAAVLATRLDP